MYAYHVVTERPMHKGQQIIFDETHHNGVYQRVQEKLSIVENIYAAPEKYEAGNLEHHTSVSLQELAMEEIRLKYFPHYPSRMSCLYVSKTLEEAENWGEFFASIGRPTYHIIRLKFEGNCFIGDATNCFNGRLNKEENLQLAEHYWRSGFTDINEKSICEMLVDGKIAVIDIVKEINRNI